MRTEDGHIISKCLNGDSAAFGLLVDKYKGGIYALAYGGITGKGLGFSQQPSDSIPMQELEEVVVTDTRIPLKREQSGKTVIQLKREDLDRYQGQSFPDVLNQLSGFEISGSRGRPGEVLGVFARGGRGRQVLVLVDGLRVTDAS